MRLLFTAAAVTYTASCTLGIAVATKRFDTSQHRWMHHALYVATATVAGIAMASPLWSDSRAGLRLLPAAVPLAAIPFAGSGGTRHTLVALSAAPFFASALLKAWR